MSMKDWTKEELTSTRDKLETWEISHKKKGSGPILWILTAILGAFAVSTGTVFIILDGVTALSIFLIVIGLVTCFSWYKSERQKKANIAFLSEVNKELKARKKTTTKSDKKKEQADKLKKVADDKADTEEEIEQTDEKALDTDKTEQTSDKVQAAVKKVASKKKMPGNKKAGQADSKDVKQTEGEK
jgi:hypothetical protein